MKTSIRPYIISDFIICTSTSTEFLLFGAIQHRNGFKKYIILIVCSKTRRDVDLQIYLQLPISPFAATKCEIRNDCGALFAVVSRFALS